MTQDPNDRTPQGVVLPLFNRYGEVINGTLVDAEDAEWLSSVNWVADGKHADRWYVVKAFLIGSNRLILRMAVEIMRYHGKYIHGLQVDHRNRDTLDNRKANLRMATSAQNQQNTSLYQNNTSGYCGVNAAKSQPHRWIARIRHKGETIALGSYSTPEEAAAAYNSKAVELFGEFANLNPGPIKGEK